MRIQGELPLRVEADEVVLEADLTLPEGARGLVVFAHGSGSSRHSPRNRHVAKVLQGARIGTLLLDLLTVDEEAVDQYTRHLRFDINLLSQRLEATANWLRGDPALSGLKMGYFGASTGAAAAIMAAARRPEDIAAVVSRGGRPDLAGPALPQIKAPTLLIVGGRDHEVIGLNQQAFERMTCEKRISIVPGATHLFEEPGTLDQTASLATEWFAQYLS